MRCAGRFSATAMADPGRAYRSQRNACLEKAFEPDHPLVAYPLNNLAVLYFWQGKYEKAEPLYKRSLSINEKALGPDHPNMITILENIADFYVKTGRTSEAKEFEERTKEIKSKYQ